MARPPAPRVTPRPQQRATAPARPRVAPRPAARPAERGRPAAPVVDEADLDDTSDELEVLAPDVSDTQALEILAPGGTSEHGGQRRWTVVEPAVARSRSVLAAQSLRALRAGVESVVISWLLVTIPVIAAYVATVAAPVLGEASWLDAARNGSAGWLLGLGQEMPVVGADGTVAAVTIAPLALTLLTAALLAGSVRRARLTHPLAFLVAAAAAGAVVGAAYSLAETSPSGRALLTTLALVVGAVTLGAARSGALPALPDSALVSAVVLGLRTGVRAALALVVLGTVTVLWLLLTRAGAAIDLQRALDAGGLSGVVLVVAQVLAIPTLAVWALAWWLGPGFSIGLVEVTHAGVTDGPLPVLPVLAALPESGPGPGAVVVLLPIAVLVGVMLRLVRTGDDWRQRVVSLVLATATAALILGALAGLSGGVDGGRIGPLDAVGTSAVQVAVATAWVTALAGALAWLLLEGARRLDLPRRYPVLGDLASAGRRLRTRVATSPLVRRFSRRA